MTGTAVATRPQLHAGAQVAAIVPRSLEEAFRVATALSASKMVPASLDSPEKVMVAIMAGAELGLAPFQSLQSFAIINGKPAIWGDGLMAVVRSQGFKVKEWLEGEGDAMIARCELTRPDNGDQAWGEFSVADAKKANLWGKAGPWQNYPKRMLKMRARAFALRDGAADVLRGFQIREEVEDYDGPISRDPPAQARAAASGTGMRARLESRSAEGGFDADHVAAQLERVLETDDVPAQFDEIDPDTGEVLDPQRDAPADDGLPVRDDSAEDFPGDRISQAKEEAEPNKTASEGSPLSLAQRIEQFKKRVDQAPGVAKLKSLWVASAAFRSDVEAADPAEAERIEQYWNAAFAVAEDKERRGE
jgi:hypothetical protein